MPDTEQDRSIAAAQGRAGVCWEPEDVSPCVRPCLKLGRLLVRAVNPPPWVSALAARGRGQAPSYPLYCYVTLVPRTVRVRRQGACHSTAVCSTRAWWLQGSTPQSPPS